MAAAKKSAGRSGGTSGGGKKPPEAHPITGRKIKHLASVALKTPSKLTTAETRELGASVLRHIEPRGGKID